VGWSNELVLPQFLPFRLNRLADAVSHNLSEIYRHSFGLEIPEWRVLVTVGQVGSCTSRDIAISTRMHKTRVSRAVASLQARKFIVRALNPVDGRERRLRLSGTGRKLYAALVPLALARERGLLGCLSAAKKESFLDALTRLEASLGL
jgi:DNA-binding MarR family transcriptional regulator